MLDEIIEAVERNKKLAEAHANRYRLAPPHAGTVVRRKPREPKLLSGVKEICAYLGISQSTYHNWRRHGLPVSRPPGSNRVFIREDTLLRWIGQTWGDEL